MIHEYDGSDQKWTSGMGKFIARTGTYNGVLSTGSSSPFGRAVVAHFNSII
jgi:hypothetical protein